MWELKQSFLCKPKVHPPDRIYKNKTNKQKKTQKGALCWKSRPPVFIGLNRVKVLVLPFPHVGWKEFLLWDGQIGPVILVGTPLTTGWWNPAAVCHEPCVNVNNLVCDPLSTSEPWFLATMFPNSTLSPHKYLPVFSGDFCQGFNY
jgi:hypothetical protein